MQKKVTNRLAEGRGGLLMLARDPHWPLELVADDGEVAPVLDLGVHDLGDDLLALAPPLGAAEAHRADRGVERQLAGRTRKGNARLDLRQIR